MFTHEQRTVSVAQRMNDANWRGHVCCRAGAPPAILDANGPSDASARLAGSGRWQAERPPYNCLCVRSGFCTRFFYGRSGRAHSLVTKKRTQGSHILDILPQVLLLRRLEDLGDFTEASVAHDVAESV